MPLDSSAVIVSLSLNPPGFSHHLKYYSTRQNSLKTPPFLQSTAPISYKSLTISTNPSSAVPMDSKRKQDRLLPVQSKIKQNPISIATRHLSSRWNFKWFFVVLRVHWTYHRSPPPLSLFYQILLLHSKPSDPYSTHSLAQRINDHHHPFVTYHHVHVDPWP